MKSIEDMTKAELSVWKDALESGNARAYLEKVTESVTFCGRIAGEEIAFFEKFEEEIEEMVNCLSRIPEEYMENIFEDFDSEDPEYESDYNRTILARELYIEAARNILYPDRISYKDSAKMYES